MRHTTYNVVVNPAVANYSAKVLTASVGTDCPRPQTGTVLLTV